MQRPQMGDRVLGWIRRRFASDHSTYLRRRGPVDHVIILDGTMSTLLPGEETNAGLTYGLLREAGHASIYYEAGVQWADWRSTADVIMGRGINRQIRRAYGYLASRYRSGDRIILLGYSRGAYAVRSLAGVIDRVGLLRADQATVRNIRNAYRLYQYGPDSAAAQRFRQIYCHADAPVEMVGVWDTVKALGLRLPLIWRFYRDRHDFHSHDLGRTIRHGFHALAADETRLAYAPVLWHSQSSGAGRLEQVWFRGTHGDVGGQLGGRSASRGLSNIPLVWMLSRLESCAVPLPDGWRARFPCDPDAPSIGGWSGLGKFFLLRQARRIGRDPSESRHPTLTAHRDASPRKWRRFLSRKKITVS